MTLDELAAMPWVAELPQDECIGWRNVSQTQLSLARHAGGLTFNGRHYVYNPLLDELIRDDIIKRATRWKREQAKASTAEKAADQPTLFPLTGEAP